jgi:hypothetical protein
MDRVNLPLFGLATGKIEDVQLNIERFVDCAKRGRDELASIVEGKRILGPLTSDETYRMMGSTIRWIERYRMTYLRPMVLRAHLYESEGSLLEMVKREATHMETIIKQCIDELQEFFEDAKKEPYALNFYRLSSTFHCYKCTAHCFFQLCSYVNRIQGQRRRM